MYIQVEIDANSSEELQEKLSNITGFSKNVFASAEEYGLENSVSLAVSDPDLDADEDEDEDEE
jgi:hypothetical protein